MALRGSEDSEGYETVAFEEKPKRRMSIAALGLLLVGLLVGSAAWISHRPQHTADFSLLIDRAETHEGVVIRWNQNRGFGFIKSDGMKDTFFRTTDVTSGSISGRDADYEGKKVEFEVTEGGRRPKVQGVKILN